MPPYHLLYILGATTVSVVVTGKELSFWKSFLLVTFVVTVGRRWSCRVLS